MIRLVFRNRPRSGSSVQVHCNRGAVALLRRACRSECQQFFRDRTLLTRSPGNRLDSSDSYFPSEPILLPTPVTKSHPVVALNFRAEPDVMSRKLLVARLL